MIYVLTFIGVVLVQVFFEESFLVVSGYLAFVTLVISLLISPMKRLGLKVPIILRKKIGLCSAIIAIYHSIYSLTIIYQLDWILIYESSQSYTGLIAVSIYLFLSITSFGKMQRCFKRPSWKELHRVVYFLPFIILIHSFYSSNQFMSYNVLILFIFLISFPLRFCKQNKKKLQIK